MGPSVIQAEQLGKRYRIGVATEPYATLRGALSLALLRRSDPASNGSELWALRDVELDVREGESVGIIGSNGAGKTTLLKLLTRITQPTTGVVRHRGRIGALLEVGTGFHPELTGRENVYLNGAILGMRKAEIDRKLEEIVTFSEVERFIDTPVKRYSTGMRMRLAFAVAAHVEPEILVVDEVLAVGDVAFQRKCLGRMGRVAREGRTVLFVSHNLTAIESLCDRVCWIDRGRLVADGTAGEVIPKYLSSAGGTSTDRAWDEPEGAPGNEWLKFRRARVYPENGGPADPITVDTPFVLEFEYDNLAPGVYLNLSLHLFTAEGTLVLNAVPVREPEWYGRPYPAGRFRDRCFVPGQLLNDGRYRVELMAVKDQGVVVHQDSAVLEFDVHDVVEKTGLYEGEWSGIVRPALGWRTEHLD
jgi:lipopolysaccharide transport system ATP-binding protein